MKAYDARKNYHLSLFLEIVLNKKKNRKVYETVVKVAWGA